MVSKAIFIASSKLSIEKYGDFEIQVYKSPADSKEHVLIMNMQNEQVRPLVRIHSSCFTGDVLGSLHCDCNKQLHYALDLIGKKGGLLIYLNQEGRGIGLSEKIKAYALQQEKGLNTIEANIELGHQSDLRKYDIAVKILNDLGVNKVELITNNPQKIAELQQHGIDAIQHSTPVFSNPKNQKYIETKMLHMGHVFKD